MDSPSNLLPISFQPPSNLLLISFVEYKAKQILKVGTFYYSCS